MLLVLYLIGKQDTIRGNTIENWGYLFIYVFGHTYVILYFDPGGFFFLVSSVVDPVPNFTNQNPLVYQSLPVSSKEIGCSSL